VLNGVFANNQVSKPPIIAIPTRPSKPLHNTAHLQHPNFTPNLTEAWMAGALQLAEALAVNLVRKEPKHQKTA
jgi:hypothetical protein